MNPLFTIGHSTHDYAKFLGLLKQHEIEVVADVRSRPFSRFPWFSRPELEKALKENDIRYVFLGLELGGGVSQVAVGGVGHQALGLRMP